MTFNLTKAETLDLAKVGSVIPITQKIFGGAETPIGIFEKLCGNGENSFLLESAEQGIWSRYSFIGVSARNEIVYKDSTLKVIGDDPVLPTRVPFSDFPLEAITQIQQSWETAQLDNLPPLTSGLVGLFGWDLIRQIERIPSTKSDPYESPTIHLQLVRDLVVLDHLENSLLLVSNIYCSEGGNFEESYEFAAERIETIKALLHQPTTARYFEKSVDSRDEVISNQTKQQFLDSVAKAKEYVRIGDVFQVVISQRFEVELRAKPVDVYRILRSINPSPYMYLLNFKDEQGSYSIVGSSPEALVKLQNGEVTMHPIAGSRPRGATPGQDEQLAAELIEDRKEQAEHLMLVDLARNDLLKVCEPDSISVRQFMKIERFSHIMHLVSDVRGNLRPDSNAISLLRATFPAGTLSGAPKPRALEIIEELEPDKRGIFGGVVGYLDFAGNADLAIAIRTAFLRANQAFVQAGAGIVLDSVAESEFEETKAKASAVLRAIKQANDNFGN